MTVLRPICCTGSGLADVFQGVAEKRLLHFCRFPVFRWNSSCDVLDVLMVRWRIGPNGLMNATSEEDTMNNAKSKWVGGTKISQMRCDTSMRCLEQERAFTRVLSALLVVGSLGITQVAEAEHFSEQTSVSEYYAIVTDIPDLDQRRNPDSWSARRNGGSQYCGPTAAADVLSYLVHEGYGGIDAPTFDFEPIDTEGLTGREEFAANLANRVKESAADDFIADLADEMGTGPFSSVAYASLSDVSRMVMGLPLDPDDYTSGTLHADLIAGLEERLPSDFSVFKEGNQQCETGSPDTITPRRIFKQLHQGNLVILKYGFYFENDCGVYERKPGHYVVVNGIVRSGDDFRLWYRDPVAEDLRLEEMEGLSREVPLDSFQSAFRSEVSDLAVTELETECGVRTMWKLLRAGAYLDSIIVVSPPEM
jgi:hypothetical protein